MTVRSKSFQAIRQLNNRTFVVLTDYSSLMHSSDSKCIFQCIPWIFFELLVSKLKFAIFFINSKDDDLDSLTHFGVLRRMIETLQPAQVTDMDHTTDSRLEFNKYTIRSNVFHQSAVTAVNRELVLDLVPGIRSHLLDRKTHLTSVFIKGNDFRFVFITQFEELLRVDRSIRPGNFTNVYQSFYARHDFQERAIIFDIHNFTFHNITFCNVLRQHIPRMRSELLQTEADTFFVVVEIQYYHIQFLVQFQHL